MIRLKTRRHAIPGSRIVIEQTTKGAPVCDVASRITKAMASKLTVSAAENVCELFVQTLIILQMTPFFLLCACDVIIRSIKAMRLKYFFPWLCR